MSKCVDASSGQPYFSFDQSLTYTCLSNVYNVGQTKAGPKSQSLIGKIQQRSRFLDATNLPICDILCVQQTEASLDKPSYIIHKRTPGATSGGRISSIPSHKRLLMQFSYDADIPLKVLIICFAKKLFRSYFKLKLQELHKCPYGDGKYLKSVMVIDDKKMLALPPFSKFTMFLPRIALQIPDIDATGNCTLATTEQMYIHKVGYLYEGHHDFFFLRSVSSKKPLFIIDSMITRVRMVRLREVNTLRTKFVMENVDNHQLKTALYNGSGLIGFAHGDNILDDTNRIIGTSSLDNKMTYTVRSAHPQDNWVAFATFNNTKRVLLVTIAGIADVKNKMLVLCHFIKFMHNECKLHYDEQPEVSVEELMEIELEQQEEARNSQYRQEEARNSQRSR